MHLSRFSALTLCLLLDKNKYIGKMIKDKYRGIKNKIKREEIYHKEKSEKNKLKLKKRKGLCVSVSQSLQSLVTSHLSLVTSN